ncbi:sugar O-acetyltransferase [Lacticaseibacillus kribbianus]|uniref:sugar O-acetyltransferase n=1 Tax=Lacticaseibacillus kribbianus TaxID=2926292 RepID=UPI001CD24198|nr:sugar O-acetyltransferase [Lacticaseibacillus kribbianus]
MATDKELMVAGKLYYSGGAELQAGRERARELVYAFNQTAPKQMDERQEILNQLIDSPSGDPYMEVPIRVDYGENVHVGQRFYANYDCILLDIAPITIGDHVMFGPRVGLYTAGHPLIPAIRNADLEYGHPITIGDNVWLGGNVTVCPGVTIGANTVVGAGAVVTHDLPANVVAAGVPAKVIRPITEADKADWEAQKAAYEATHTAE